VFDFILDNSSENNKIFEVLKLVTYKDYTSEFYKLHEIISENYSGKQNDNSFDTAINLLNEFINKEKYELKEEDLFSGLETFRTNDGEEIIKEYTKETIYKDINNWLLNLDNLAYQKVSYFVGQLMYKLNDLGKTNNLGYKKNKPITLYRGMYINYLDALSYQIHKGRKICFQTFVSTSKNEEVARNFSEEEDIDERKKEFKFCLLIKIKHQWKEEFCPLCFNIASISNIEEEEEYLFHPYTFFKINDLKVDYKTNQIQLKVVTINKREILEEKINKNTKIHYNKIDKVIEVKDKNNNVSESENESESESESENKSENENESKSENKSEKESESESKEEKEEKNDC
jgi:hypothetical protein